MICFQDDQCPSKGCNHLQNFAVKRYDPGKGYDKYIVKFFAAFEAIISVLKQETYQQPR